MECAVYILLCEKYVIQKCNTYNDVHDEQTRIDMNRIYENIFFQLNFALYYAIYVNRHMTDLVGDSLSRSQVWPRLWRCYVLRQGFNI